MEGICGRGKESICKSFEFLLVFEVSVYHDEGLEILKSLLL